MCVWNGSIEIEMEMEDFKGKERTGKNRQGKLGDIGYWMRYLSGGDIFLHSKFSFFSQQIEMNVKSKCLRRGNEMTR